jgi:glycosyltransferase involved in cell wall biosynthesis
MIYPTSSLVIGTYNWPAALELCIKSALMQKTLPGEILIADDGSGPETRQLIQSLQNKAAIPIRHIWQEDTGFRLAHIRNKAIAAATGDYIIQVDGDIIMHPWFMDDHLRFAKKNSFVRASRIYLDAALTKELMSSKDIRINIFNKGVSNFFSAVRIPLLWPLFAHNYKKKGAELYEIHGCNMAFWKCDALEINGYNEEFMGWGPEDKEFVARLLNAGKAKRFLKAGAIAFHLDHPVNAKPNIDNNERLLKQTILSKSAFCVTGIDKYSN